MSGLSIDSKLPIVAYATAFDHFAMACQLLLLSIILGALEPWDAIRDVSWGFGREEIWNDSWDLMEECMEWWLDFIIKDRD